MKWGLEWMQKNILGWITENIQVEMKKWFEEEEKSKRLKLWSIILNSVEQ